MSRDDSFMLQNNVKIFIRLACRSGMLQSFVDVRCYPTDKYVSLVCKGASPPEVFHMQGSSQAFIKAGLRVMLLIEDAAEVESTVRIHTSAGVVGLDRMWTKERHY